MFLAFGKLSCFCSISYHLNMTTYVLNFSQKGFCQKENKFETYIRWKSFAAINVDFTKWINGKVGVPLTQSSLSVEDCTQTMKPISQLYMRYKPLIMSQAVKFVTARFPDHQYPRMAYGMV